MRIKRVDAHDGGGAKAPQHAGDGQVSSESDRAQNSEVMLNTSNPEIDRWAIADRRSPSRRQRQQRDGDRQLIGVNHPDGTGRLALRSRAMVGSATLVIAPSSTDTVMLRAMLRIAPQRW